MSKWIYRLDSSSPTSCKEICSDGIVVGQNNEITGTYLMVMTVIAHAISKMTGHAVVVVAPIIALASSVPQVSYRIAIKITES